jgi:hypothetical protein
VIWRLSALSRRTCGLVAHLTRPREPTEEQAKQPNVAEIRLIQLISIWLLASSAEGRRYGSPISLHGWASSTKAGWSVDVIRTQSQSRRQWTIVKTAGMRINVYTG